MRAPTDMTNPVFLLVRLGRRREVNGWSAFRSSATLRQNQGTSEPAPIAEVGRFGVGQALLITPS